MGALSSPYPWSYGSQDLAYSVIAPASPASSVPSWSLVTSEAFLHPNLMGDFSLASCNA